MAADQAPAGGPDFTKGVDIQDLTEGVPLLGRVGDEPVILVRRGDEVFAIGAHCTHYGGPLAEGLVTGEAIRCPWHHACFSLRTGAAERAPALNPVDCWAVARHGDRVQVTEKAAAPAPAKRGGSGHPGSVVIVGGGAAGACAAETLRNEGYEGAITILSADADGPVDRPNLSKDYLAGNAPEEWIPLRPPEFYAEHRIDLKLKTRVTAIDPAGKTVVTEDGGSYAYGALLLATGAEPVRLPTPGADQPQVHYLRTLADSRALIAAAEKAKRAVVVGASFIGLEVAASLRTRGLEVDVVAPEAVPMAKVLGPELGGLVRRTHEDHGVRFHLGRTVASIGADAVTLDDGQEVPADLVVFGVGVRPLTALAEQAGLKTEKGVLVDAFLRTSDPAIYAAGDIARWPDALTGQPIRVEHWVVAERQGQTAARNMLGAQERFDPAAFFWSQHYDLVINYVGHAEDWDEAKIDGDLDARDCRVRYRKGGKLLAVATIGRDMENLKAEVELEAASG
jgi:NADPH-dependent 2,4-dienoyl-CoA reductase/sulfur reductase-like enzyme/nitrite reductase/ring-hydroxylating ferredoxin subunit